MVNINKFKNKSNTDIPYGYIYKTTNKLTGEIYIGKHILKNEPWRAYLGSGEQLQIAIKMFGRENFIKTFEAYEYSHESLAQLELKIMNEYRDKMYEMYNRNFNSPAFSGLGIHDMDKVKQKEIWAKGANTRKINAQKLFDDKITEIGAQNIIDYYNQVGHMKKTKDHFGINEKERFRQFLIDNGVEINSQNTVGKARDEKTKESIRKARLKNIEENVDDLVNEDFINECKYCHKNYVTKRNKTTGGLYRVSCDDCRKAKTDGKIEYILLNRQCDNNSCGRTYQASVNKFTKVPVNRYCSEKCGGFKNKYNSQNITKEELSDLYVNKQYSIKELCEYYGCGKSAIYGRLQKFEIPTQGNAKLNTTFNNKKEFSITEDNSEVIEFPIDANGNYSLF